ncbi:nucleotidyltransferase domain-containing protein [Candidatus Bathyarchaeota archaeon]|nr:nucleotidyltransferase domain-containing protein [Candidatus Bathyarchaeota archaeon]MBS7629890.1 nucleotidyltransferase domain-containing protein [Candidatus Bathyarchaeota archaeon]
MVEMAYRDLKLERIVEVIEKTLLMDERITLALIFGSTLRRTKVMDIDLTVYATPQLNMRESLILASRLEERVGFPIDLSPLTELPPCMRYKAMSKGLKVVLKDKKIFNEILTSAFSQCQDLNLLLIHCSKSKKL